MPRSHGSGQEYCVLGVSGYGTHSQIQPEKFKSFGKGVVIESSVRIFEIDKVSVGDQVYIGHSAIIKGYHKSDAEVVIQDRVWIGENVYIHGAGGITIEEDVVIAPGTYILTSHQSPYDTELVIHDNSIELHPIHIGKGAVVDFGSRVTPGVFIGRYAYVSPGSVVTESIPDYAIAAGNPAKVIDRRKIAGREKLSFLEE